MTEPQPELDIYFGSYMNEDGKTLVFIQEANGEAFLANEAFDSVVPLRSNAILDRVLSTEEAEWLKACWTASNRFRPAGERDLPLIPDPVEFMNVSLVARGTKLAPDLSAAMITRIKRKIIHHQDQIKALEGKLQYLLA